MNIHQNDTSVRSEYFMPANQTGRHLSATESAALNLSIMMIEHYSERMLARINNPGDRLLAKMCSTISRRCSDYLVNNLKPSARSAATGDIRNVAYSEAERSAGLSVASMCATLDPYNTVAWSLIYQLLPNDNVSLLVQTDHGVKAYDRSAAERAMFHTISFRQR